MRPQSEMTFRYLHDLRDCWHETTTSDCVVCGLPRYCFGFIEWNEEGYEVHYVCDACLISGRLAEKNLRVNDGDIDSVLQQLRQQMPDLSDEEQNALAAERTDEAEQRTPRPNVLNLFTWPVHCGDYCVYFQRVDADDLRNLAPNGEGKTFLSLHLHAGYFDADEEFIENVWEDELKGFMRFYLWQCLHCSEYLLTCDSD